jgi:hypothetical protein
LIGKYQNKNEIPVHFDGGHASGAFRGHRPLFACLAMPRPGPERMMDHAPEKQLAFMAEIYYNDADRHNSIQSIAGGYQ